MRQRLRLGHIECRSHHQADGAGHAVAIAQQFVHVGKAHLTEVAPDTTDQLERDRRIDVTGIHQLQHVAHFGVV